MHSTDGRSYIHMVGDLFDTNHKYISRPNGSDCHN